MEQLIERCAGLDVHKDGSGRACGPWPGRAAPAAHRTFATTTKGLVALHDWLANQQVTVVGMESTGVHVRHEGA